MQHLFGVHAQTEQLKETLCNMCKGSGSSIKKENICKKCNGKRFKMEKVNVDQVNIEKINVQKQDWVSSTVQNEDASSEDET